MWPSDYLVQYLALPQHLNFAVGSQAAEFARATRERKLCRPPRSRTASLAERSSAAAKWMTAIASIRASHHFLRSADSIGNLSAPEGSRLKLFSIVE